MKRFYSDVSWRNTENGFEVFLDARALKSPAKQAVILPNQALCEAIVAEWDAVGDKIDPAAMPQFSLAVTVIDRVSPQRAMLIAEMVGYGMNDLLAYREEADPVLMARQAERWDSWLAWGRAQHQLAFVTTKGIMPITQDGANRQRLVDAITALNDWQLGVLVRATSLGGSLILGLGFVHQVLEADALFSLSFLDELYQNERWGTDFEATARHANIQAELSAAQQFLTLL